MKIAIPSELLHGEKRVPVIPDGVAKLVKAGAEVVIQAGMGAPSRHFDDAYTAAGATVSTDREAMIRGADMVLRLGKPPAEEVAWLKPGCIHVSYLDPFFDPALTDALAAAKISAIGMEMIPRTTRAQKMDALSSQANLAGYACVTLAAAKLDKVFPMIMSPAGTIQPARVLIVGVGVAGLQAIATAKRLGARVEAYDTRPETAEQIESLGAKAVKLDIGETGTTDRGYAKELTNEQKAEQQRQLAKVIANADVLITTAALFGRKPPQIVNAEMVAGMRSGSVIVDLAVSDTGGNVAGSKFGEVIVTENGVTIIGLANFPSEVAINASQVYSANLTNLVLEFWDKETKAFNLNREDEIIKGCLVTHDGALVNDFIKSRRA